MVLLGNAGKSVLFTTIETIGSFVELIANDCLSTFIGLNTFDPTGVHELLTYFRTVDLRSGEK
ncbi:hypothetical protein D3C86_1981450 [compost metagenome]